LRVQLWSPKQLTVHVAVMLLFALIDDDDKRDGADNGHCTLVLLHAVPFGLRLSNALQFTTREDAWSAKMAPLRQ
jgi:hypothetical protein